MRIALLVLLAALGGAQENDAELAAKKLRVAPGLRVELFASEPQVQNPVAFSIDEKGRVFVSETHRLGTSVYDIRNYMAWLDDDLACRTVADRLAMYRKHLGADAEKLAVESEVVQLLEDTDGDGKADRSGVFADGFKTQADGLASGVLARQGQVWFANIPNLWLLRDRDGDGKADDRSVLHTGYGVHLNYIGHDLHGLVLGPDGKLYFSIGDRGLNVETEGRRLFNPDSGAVLRCAPDGSGLELVHVGLRNPQELAFDQHGNLWTWDNNSDWHDMARWVQVVEGGDSGWRIGYQFLPGRGPWDDERVWEKDGDAPYRLPPLANIDHGPSGIAFYPGTGLPARYDDHFLLCNFPGGVNSWAVKPKGASFEVVDRGEFLWGAWATDVEFGPDGAVYVSDWGEGWAMKGQGRIYRVSDPAFAKDPAVLEVKRLLSEGMEKRASAELAQLLGHRDQRVRQAAQFELASRGPQFAGVLADAAATSDRRLARLHAIWGLAQTGTVDPLVPLLRDKDAEVRAQAAKAIGDRRYVAAAQEIAALFGDPDLRVRFHALLAAAKLGRKEAFLPAISSLSDGSGKDPYFRHAAVMALSALGDPARLASLARSGQEYARMPALLALRRRAAPEIRAFLESTDSALVFEAARAIHDAPIDGALRDLGGLLLKSCPPKALSRAVNACFMTGDAETLAQAVARRDLPAPVRVSALQALQEWDRTAGRDRVVGTWRVLPARDGREGLRAMRGAWEAVLADPEDAVVVEALRARGDAAVGAVRAIALDRAKPAAVRAEAARSLLSARQESVQTFLADPEERIRVEAVRALGPDSVADRARTLERIVTDDLSLRVRQAALAALGALDGRGADESILRLLATELPAGLRFDLEEAASKRTSAPVKEKVAALPRDGRRLLEGGDVAVGEAVYARVDASCARCHRIRNGGGTVGPDLTLVGSRLSREKLLESILDPNKEVTQGYEQILVKTRSGDVLSGRREKEDDRTLVLMDAEGRLRAVAKADIEDRKEGKSAMPEDYAKKLSPRDLRDLVAYLAARAGRDPKATPLERGAVVVDDEDPGFRVEGNWRREPLGGDYGKGAHWAFPDPTGRAKAVWTAALPRPGRYRVFAWSGIDPVGVHATNAPFAVEYEGGVRTARVDTTKDTCTWRPLGSFVFGATGRVVLSTDADARVYADAVKFVPE